MQKNLHTKFLGVCQYCKTAKWSKKFIKSIPIETEDYQSHISSVLSNVDFIFNTDQKYFALRSGTFIAGNKRSRTAYAIRLDKSWGKKGIKYDYYIGGTGKHPAIRYLEHLIPKYKLKFTKSKLNKTSR